MKKDITYPGEGQAYPGAHRVQFVWFVNPYVVSPNWQAIGDWVVEGHMNPAPHSLHVASPFNEYVPGGQAPDNDIGVGQVYPAGHGEQYETAW